MQVTLTNTGNQPLADHPHRHDPDLRTLADNLRDHRHVTSLLHRSQHDGARRVGDVPP